MTNFFVKNMWWIIAGIGISILIVELIAVAKEGGRWDAQSADNEIDIAQIGGFDPSQIRYMI